jgi:hypothetical protein
MQCVSVAFMVRIAVLCCLGALMFGVTGCRGHSSAQEVGSVEPYISDPNSVGFDISPLPSNDRSRRSLATHSDQNKTAKFTIEIGPSAPMDSEAAGGLKMSSGSGAILAVADSHASTMLVALAKALEAKHQCALIHTGRSGAHSESITATFQVCHSWREQFSSKRGWILR